MRVCGLKRNIRLVEPDSRVDEGDQNVRDDVADQQQQAREENDAHDYGVIPVEDRCQPEQTETVNIEDGLQELIDGLGLIRMKNPYSNV